MTPGPATYALSGGEYQSLKLAREQYKQENVCVLDEPSARLHGQDVKYLLTQL